MSIAKPLLIGLLFSLPFYSFGQINENEKVFILSEAKNKVLEKVFINEICWMGTKDSSSDEWLELYNNSNQTVNLLDWFIESSDKKLIIPLKGSINSKSFFLLERTNDNTVKDIFADQIYSGSLNNSGLKLELFDKDRNIIDSVDCSLGWIKGDKETMKTMERINFLSSPTSWQTSKEEGGTPKAINSLGEEIKDKKEINYQTASLKDINFPLFLKALLVSMFSIVVILILKSSLKKKDERT